MTESSRTSESLLNARVSLVFYFIQIILGFFSRKAFFDYLGSEVLGLNTTATNLIGFLNLAELGVSSSVAFFLYKPLFDDDRDSMNKIISIQGWLYRMIAFFIIGVACILMLFFPLIFAKSPLPLWYAYSTFGVLLFSAMLGYFFNYRQILLTANQKNYVVQRVTQGLIIIKVILQILAISYLSNPFIWWLVLEFGFAIITCILLDRAIKKTYPWLKTEISKGKEYVKEFPDVIKKTKQVFVHKLSAVVLQQSSPLIVYAFTSLTIVAYYGNYILIIGKLSQLISTVFNSTGAAVGNLVASNDEKRKIKVFWELFESRLCISVIALICAYHLTNPFISIWLGEEYLLSSQFILLFVIMQGILMTRTTVDSFINAHGLYQDIYAPLAEASLNILLSICFGALWGLEGIILGITISMVMVVEMWKPYFLFTRGLKVPPKYYFVTIIKNIFLIVIVSLLVSFLVKRLPCYNNRSQNYLIWGLFSIEVLALSSILLFVCFYIFTEGFRDFINRFRRLISKRVS